MGTMICWRLDGFLRARASIGRRAGLRSNRITVQMSTGGIWRLLNVNDGIIPEDRRTYGKNF